MPDLPVPVPSRGRRLHPSLARAAVSPTAVAAGAVGAGIGVLDHSVVVAVVLAGCGWAGRMVAAVLARRRQDRVSAPRAVDPWSVPEPWRTLLRQAVTAESRFEGAVAAWPPGPVRDRLGPLLAGVHEEVRRLEVTARRGAAAAGWDGATFSSGRPAAPALTEEMRAIQAERARLGPSAGAREAELARREQAAAAQLRAVQRAQQVEDELHDRLRRAVARLDQTVSELLVMEPPSSGPDAAFTATVEEVSDGVASLRAALDETAGAPPAGTEP